MCIENDLSQIKEKINEIEKKSADWGVTSSVGNVNAMKKCPQTFTEILMV